MWRFYVLSILLILAGILALSSFIVAKKPDAKATLDKLVPAQAGIGVGLLVMAILFWLDAGIVNLFRYLSIAPVPGLIFIAAVFSGILLGALFGMPQIAKWIPGESSAEQKALELSKKVAPIQMIVGVIALVAGIGLLLIRFGIIKLF